MNKLILIFFTAISFSSCQSSSDISKEYKENPCQDLQYLKLKQMKITEMTGSESQYFKMKTKECEQYTEDVKTKVTDSNFLMLIAGLGIAAGVIISLAFILGGGH